MLQAYSVAVVAGKLGGSVIQSRSEHVNINGTSFQEPPDTREQHLQIETEEVREELRYTVIEHEGNVAVVHTASLLVTITLLCLLLIHWVTVGAVSSSGPFTCKHQVYDCVISICQ